MKTRVVSTLAFVVTIGLLALLASGDISTNAQGSNFITRVSIASDGTQGNGDSTWYTLQVSGNGRYVAFASSASNLVPGDTNNRGDVFVHDMQTGQTTRVSVASDGSDLNGDSSWPSISADGRLVVFHNSGVYYNYDIFVHDRQTGQTTQVSVASDDTPGNGVSLYPYVSADGRFVAFTSRATNLVPNDTNQTPDVFVHDLTNGQTTRVSVASDGTQANADCWATPPVISADGRFVAYSCNASNLVPGDTNGMEDVFVHDMQTGQTTRVSVASDGTQGNEFSATPSISGDGRFVAFHAGASNLVPGRGEGIYIHDRSTGQTTFGSAASDGTSLSPPDGFLSISWDGRYLAFSVIGGGTFYLYVRDLIMGQTTLISVAPDGSGQNGDSRFPSITPDGHFVAFSSRASNLVSGDTNGCTDTFVYDASAKWLPNSISGRVTDDMGNGAPGVTLTASNGSSAITNATGYYTITNLITGTHMITPTMTGYRFAPSSISSIGVPPDRTGKDFKIRPAVPGTFLDLPVYYQDLMAVRSEAFVVAALGSNGGQGPGRVNSWFDHEVPLYNLPNNILTRWDGQDFYTNDMISVGNCSTPPGKLGETCYDYHNGIDFRQKTKYVDEFVLAAGAGIVITPTITGYGNAVMINHQNGYATFYGHLKDGSILVHPGDSVTTGQKVGTMGNTGPGSKGPHLHFGVYYDKNGVKNSYGFPNWTEQEVVDPYGWIPQKQPTRPDPWSVSSFPLWVYSLNGQCTLTSAGISKTSASGKVVVTAPPNAVSSPVTLEIWDTPPAAGASAQLRSAGRSFWVRVLEWLSGNSRISRNNSSAASGGFAQPLTLQVEYGVTETQHLDTSLLSLYRWNASTWLSLPTTIDQGQKRTSAQTTETGNFDLQAPLLCPADTREVDDTFDAAHRIIPDGTIVNDLFDIARDEDWFRLDAIGGIHNIVQTRNLAAGVDTILQVYDLDGTSVLASDDNSGGGKASRLVWQPPQDGPYFIRVSQAPGSSFGCSASYQLRVIQEGDLFLPFIRK